MSDLTAAAGASGRRADHWVGFEQKAPRREGLERAAGGALARLRAPGAGLRGRRCRAVVAPVLAEEAGLRALTDRALLAYARKAGQVARRGEVADLACAAPLFAAAREAVRRETGIALRPVQFAGGYATLRGWLAEMRTGEGKTLTAVLPAAAMALAGRPVHVVTVNDYLAARDAEATRPIFRRLGLSVGLVVQGATAEARRAAYAAGVTYCTNNELAFDFLKDRLAGAGGRGPLGRRVAAAHGDVDASGLQRGLAFALIDEADSVLVDEARTPLILSGPGPALFPPETIRAAAALADRLEARDFRVLTAARRVELTEAGKHRLESADDAALTHRGLREELVVKALTATHLYRRDEHYLVRDGKVMIIDEYTGRVMPDRFWSDGLHQMIENREGVEQSGGRVTLARTTFQRFFTRYDRIGGLSGTLREEARELWNIYGTPVARIPTHSPSRLALRRPIVVRRSDEKWTRIVAEVVAARAAGRPVLLGTRSVAETETASAALHAGGIEHVVLSAAQDAAEAAIIADAGAAGRVTVATNMAGRGADIRLPEAVRARGGLHVIMSEAHDSPRIDRQLAGRAGRQGDPGSFQAILALDDDLLSRHLPGALRRLSTALPLRIFGPWLVRLAQWRAERLHARMRTDLQRLDEVLTDAMAFAGTPD